MIPDALILVIFSEVNVETPEELMLPVKFPVTLPEKPLVAVIIPDALILVAFRLVMVPLVLLNVVIVPAVPVRFVIVPLVLLTVTAVTIPLELTLPTLKLVRVPTEVKDELTTPLPKVLLERTSVLLTL